jgi:hypothetical protein
MSKRGCPSTAHEYKYRGGECIHCLMYQNTIEGFKHNCTPERERIQDAKDAFAEAESARIKSTKVIFDVKGGK